MMYTTKQVAEKLGVTNTTVRALREQNKIKGLKIGKGNHHHHYRYYSKSVHEYLASLKEEKKVEKAAKVFKVIPNETLAKVYGNESPGIMTILKRMDAKLDLLVRIWS